MSKQPPQIPASKSGTVPRHEAKKKKPATSASTLRKMLNGNYEYKISTKGTISFGSRTMLEWISELKDAALKPTHFGFMGKNILNRGTPFVLGDIFVKAFMYSQEYKEANHVPKGTRPADVLSPLAYDFTQQRSEEIKQIATDLLTFWGLLQNWLEKSNAELIEFKKVFNEFVKASSHLRTLVSLKGYQESVDSLCTDKFAGSLVALMRCESQLKTALSSAGDEVKLPELASDFIGTLKSNTAIHKFLAEAKLVLTAPELHIETAKEMLAKAQAYIFAIASSSEGVEWLQVNAAHQQVIQCNQRLLPSLTHQKSLDKLTGKVGRVIRNTQDALAEISSRVIADGLAESKNPLLSQPPSGEAKIVKEYTKFARISELSDKDLLINDLYARNSQHFQEMLNILDLAIRHMQALLIQTGDFNELSVLDNFTTQFNVLGKGSFRDINRQTKLLATIMKFFIYFSELQGGFGPEVFDQKISDRRKLSRTNLQVKARELADEYQRSHSEGILDFLREHQLVTVDFQAEEKEDKLGFVERFERTILVLDFSTSFFSKKFNIVLDLFGKKPISLTSSSSMVKRSEPYHDADFICLFKSPSIAGELDYWKELKGSDGNVFPDMPLPSQVEMTTFSRDEVRSRYRDKLGEMITRSQGKGYYNTYLKLSHTYLQQQLHFLLSVVQLVMKAESKPAYFGTGGDALARQDLQEEYNSVLENAGNYLAAVDFLHDKLEEISSQSVAVANFRKLLATTSGSLVSFCKTMQTEKRHLESGAWSKAQTAFKRTLTVQYRQDVSAIAQTSVAGLTNISLLSQQSFITTLPASFSSLGVRGSISAPPPFSGSSSSSSSSSQVRSVVVSSTTPPPPTSLPKSSSSSSQSASSVAQVQKTLSASPRVLDIFSDSSDLLSAIPKPLEIKGNNGEGDDLLDLTSFDAPQPPPSPPKASSSASSTTTTMSSTSSSKGEEKQGEPKQEPKQLDSSSSASSTTATTSSTSSSSDQQSAGTQPDLLTLLQQHRELKKVEGDKNNQGSSNQAEKKQEETEQEPKQLDSSSSASPTPAQPGGGGLLGALLNVKLKSKDKDERKQGSPTSERKEGGLLGALAGVESKVQAVLNAKPKKKKKEKPVQTPDDDDTFGPDEESSEDENDPDTQRLINPSRDVLGSILHQQMDDAQPKQEKATTATSATPNTPTKMPPPRPIKPKSDESTDSSKNSSSAGSSSDLSTSLNKMSQSALITMSFGSSSSTSAIPSTTSKVPPVQPTDAKSNESTDSSKNSSSAGSSSSQATATGATGAGSDSSTTADLGPGTSPNNAMSQSASITMSFSSSSSTGSSNSNSNLGVDDYGVPIPPPPPM